MLMSGCFSSVSQVYRKRDRLDPGGDNRCDGAEHDRGCAYEPRWRRLQLRRRGDSGESKNRAGEPLKARFGSDTETVRTAQEQRLERDDGDHAGRAWYLELQTPSDSG